MPPDVRCRREPPPRTRAPRSPHAAASPEQRQRSASSGTSGTRADTHDPRPRPDTIRAPARRRRAPPPCRPRRESAPPSVRRRARTGDARQRTRGGAPEARDASVHSVWPSRTLTSGYGQHEPGAITCPRERGACGASGVVLAPRALSQEREPEALTTPSREQHRARRGRDFTREVSSRAPCGGSCP